MKMTFAKKYPALSLIFFVFTSLSVFQSDFSLALPNEENPLQGNATLSVYDLVPGKPFTLMVNLSLPSGYRAYGDKLKLEIEDPEGFAYKTVKVEPIQSFFDENTKMKKMGIIGSAILLAPMEAPSHLASGDYKLHVSIEYQACTKSYCLFPAKLHLEIPFTFTEEIPGVSPQKTSPMNFMGLNFEQALKKGLFWTFLVVFFAGFLTSLTPCIFPIIPITIAVLGRHAHLHSKGKNFILSILYVLGIAVTYAGLGIFAAGTGAIFGSFMSHPIVLAVICFIFLIMSLSMFGLFELQAPEFIRRRSAGLQVSGYHSAFIYGIIAGVVAGPCVGPVLVGILTFVAKSQNMWLGFWLLFDFAIGMGILFIAIGFSSQLTKMLPKSGAWMDSIKHFFGVMMLSASFYYLGLLAPQRWWDLILGIALAVGGSYFGAFESVQSLTPAGKIRKGLSQVLIFVGAAFVTIGLFDLRPFLQIGNANSVHGEFAQESHWISYSESELASAKQKGKPVIIDFWADWCGACKELEQYTFATESFKQNSKNFVLMKFDATADSDELNRLRAKYGIVGLPTLIFYDSKGQQRVDLTTTEFIEAPELVKKMESLR